jgi:four helix bundle protein
MLRIYDVILDVVKALRPVIGRIERKDADLARQMRRAVSSVALNCAEGIGRAAQKLTLSPLGN